MIRPEELATITVGAQVEKHVDSLIRRAHDRNDWPAAVTLDAFASPAVTARAVIATYGALGWRVTLEHDNDDGDWVGIDKPAPVIALRPSDLGPPGDPVVNRINDALRVAHCTGRWPCTVSVGVGPRRDGILALYRDAGWEIEEVTRWEISFHRPATATTSA